MSDREKLSRRSALKLLSAGAGVLAVGTGAGLLGYELGNHKKEVNNFPTELSLSTEQRRLIEETVKYRAQLGLKGLPNSLTPDRITQSKSIEWDPNAPAYENAITPAHKSFAMQADRTARLLFGDNAKHLLRRVKENHDPLSGGTFDVSTRILDVDVDGDPNSEWNRITPAHELFHAVDPELITEPIFPLQKLIQIAHGSARLLSQSVKVEGHYFQDDDYYNVRYIKLKLGEGVGRLFLRDKMLLKQVDEFGHKEILKIIAEIQKQQGTSVDQIIFDKKTCHLLGDRLVPLIISGSIRIDDELYRNWYEPNMEGALVEMFVSVASESLTVVGAPTNTEILSGIAEILSSVREKDVDIYALCENLRSPSAEVDERYQAELTLQNNQVAAEISPEEAKQIEIAINEEKIRQTKIDSFINDGIIPKDLCGDNTTNQEIMQEYATTMSHTYKVYPEILTALQNDDLAFDLDRHVWETYIVAEAANFYIVLSLILNPERIANEIKDIARRNKILNEFATSPEFIQKESNLTMNASQIGHDSAPNSPYAHYLAFQRSHGSLKNKHPRQNIQSHAQRVV